MATEKEDEDKLREAIENNDLEALRQLKGRLTRDQINYSRFPGTTPLNASIERGCSPDLVSYLISDLGADPDASDRKGRSPLLMAVMEDNLVALGLLLRLGAEPNEPLNSTFCNL